MGWVMSTNDDDKLLAAFGKIANMMAESAANKAGATRPLKVGAASVRVGCRSVAERFGRMRRPGTFCGNCEQEEHIDDQEGK